MVIVKRALLSCHDKSGLETFAKALAARGVELIASGGTADVLRRQGLRVKTVEEFAGITEQLDGRVKTLHPKVHAGILARRDDPAHVRAVGPDGLIDLVAVTLYPFAETAQRRDASLAEAVEQIDVGGVALLRAAAKNCAHVAAVSEPQQYGSVIEALQQGKGELPETMTRALAASAFRLTSGYDARIARYLAAGDTPERPDRVSLSVRRRQPLRYGENPHQQAGWYAPDEAAMWGLGMLSQLQGKELSYNNLLDVDAALRCLLDFEAPACTIVKHGSHCGTASAATARLAYERAYACDPESVFGGIVGFNRPIDGAIAERLTSAFLEVVLAPSVDEAAARCFATKPNLRVVALEWPSRRPEEREWRQLLGAWLLQEPDRLVLADEPPTVATKRAPTDGERGDLVFAWTVAKHVKSNAIVLAHDRATVGIGQGQPSRVGSSRLAIEKAGARSRGAVAASDGFFPFPDGIELLAKAGATAVIQPGGSIRDAEVIEAADRADLAMLVTGVRHFRH